MADPNYPTLSTTFTRTEVVPDADRWQLYYPPVWACEHEGSCFGDHPINMLIGRCRIEPSKTPEYRCIGPGPMGDGSVPCPGRRVAVELGQMASLAAGYIAGETRVPCECRMPLCVSCGRDLDAELRCQTMDCALYSVFHPLPDFRPYGGGGKVQPKLRRLRGAI